MADFFFDDMLNLWTLCCTASSEMDGSSVVEVLDPSLKIPRFNPWNCTFLVCHPLGLGCLESTLASMWFTKNAPHRIIRGGGSGWVKSQVGGSKVGWAGRVQSFRPG